MGNGRSNLAGAGLSTHSGTPDGPNDSSAAPTMNETVRSLDSRPKKARRTVLLADDSKSFVAVIGNVLNRQYNVLSCYRPEDALEIIASHHVDILLADLFFDEADTEMDGFSLLERMAQDYPEIPIIVVSRTEDPRDTTRILDLGAFSFVSKHFDPDELTSLIHRAIHSRFLERQYEFLRTRDAIVEGDIIHKCAAMQRVLDDVKRFAPSHTPVLITGETGTGKDLVAKLIHQRSGREGPYHALNISSLSESLFEAELFGHERGAFTDARASRPGLIEMSDGGTLFLDEIGAVAPEKQAALLRVIEDGRIRRVGSGIERPVDVRFLFATNDDLEDMVRRGLFREDLWYRLSRLQIHLPALRERETDVLYIAEALLQKLERYHSCRLGSDARELLLRADLKGNVRELEGLLERAVLYDDDGIIDGMDLERAGLRLNEASDDEMTATSAAVPSDGNGSGDPFEDTVRALPSEELIPYADSSTRLTKALRARLVEQSLALYGGNVTKAAKHCGVSRPTFYGWLLELGYAREASPPSSPGFEDGTDRATATDS